MALLRRRDDDVAAEPGRLAMPRRRGAASGLLIVLLGLWGGVIPFIGHYLHLVIGSDRAWDFTAGRFWLSLVPAAVTVLGGLLLMSSANRASGALGAWCAILGGAWFVVGPVVSMLWNHGTPQTGNPLGGTDRQVLEWLVYFYGLGALITALGGIAHGRVSARHAGDVERLAPATGTGRFTRNGAAADEPETARPLRSL
jgi:hypothetical protein